MDLIQLIAIFKYLNAPRRSHCCLSALLLVATTLSSDEAKHAHIKQANTQTYAKRRSLNSQLSRRQDMEEDLEKKAVEKGSARSGEGSIEAEASHMASSDPSSTRPQPTLISMPSSLAPPAE